MESKDMLRLLRIPIIGEWIIKVFGDRAATDPSRALAGTEKVPELIEKLKKTNPI